MKPLLYRHAGTWWCRRGDILGYGETPAIAFSCWLRESLARYNCT